MSDWVVNLTSDNHAYVALSNILSITYDFMSDLVKGDLHRVLHYINCLKHNLRHAVEFTFFCLSDFSFTGSSLKSQIFIRLSSPHICTKKNNMEEKK